MAYNFKHITFQQLKPERERLGMTEETAMNRIDIFRKNYDSLSKMLKRFACTFLNDLHSQQMDRFSPRVSTFESYY